MGNWVSVNSKAEESTSTESNDNWVTPKWVTSRLTMYQPKGEYALASRLADYVQISSKANINTTTTIDNDSWVTPEYVSSRLKNQVHVSDKTLSDIQPNVVWCADGICRVPDGNKLCLRSSGGEYCFQIKDDNKMYFTNSAGNSIFMMNMDPPKNYDEINRKKMEDMKDREAENLK